MKHEVWRSGKSGSSYHRKASTTYEVDLLTFFSSTPLEKFHQKIQNFYKFSHITFTAVKLKWKLKWTYWWSKMSNKKCSKKFSENTWEVSAYCTANVFFKQRQNIRRERLSESWCVTFCILSPREMMRQVIKSIYFCLVVRSCHLFAEIFLCNRVKATLQNYTEKCVKHAVATIHSEKRRKTLIFRKFFEQIALICFFFWETLTTPK